MFSLFEALIPSLPPNPPDLETLRAYVIIPICFHFAQQYKWPKLDQALVSFARKFLAIKGGGEKVLRYWSGSLGQVRILFLKDQHFDRYFSSSKVYGI